MKRRVNKRVLTLATAFALGTSMAGTITAFAADPVLTVDYDVTECVSQWLFGCSKYETTTKSVEFTDLEAPLSSKLPKSDYGWQQEGSPLNPVFYGDVSVKTLKSYADSTGHIHLTELGSGRDGGQKILRDGITNSTSISIFDSLSDMRNDFAGTDQQVVSSFPKHENGDAVTKLKFNPSQAKVPVGFDTRFLMSNAVKSVVRVQHYPLRYSTITMKTMFGKGVHPNQTVEADFMGTIFELNKPVQGLEGHDTYGEYDNAELNKQYLNGTIVTAVLEDGSTITPTATASDPIVGAPQRLTINFESAEQAAKVKEIDIHARSANTQPLTGMSGQELSKIMYLNSAKGNFGISASDAFEMAKSGTQSVTNGNIDVVARWKTGSFFDGNYPGTVQSNNAIIGFTLPKVTFKSNADDAFFGAKDDNVTETALDAKDLEGALGKPGAFLKLGDDALASAIPVRDGYRFTGWNTEPDGSGKQFTGASEVPWETGITVYAQWARKILPINPVPVITTESRTITAGQKIDLMSLVTSATDKVWDESTGEFKDVVCTPDAVADGCTLTISDDDHFDSSKPGVYTITFKATDRDGASFTQTAKVTVLPAQEMINPAPNLQLHDATFVKGNGGKEFNLLSLVSSATDQVPTADGEYSTISCGASDSPGVGCRLEIVDDGHFDKDKVGKYTVTIRATDAAGATTEKSATVTVTPVTAPSTAVDPAPVIKLHDAIITEGNGGKEFDLYSLVSSATDEVPNTKSGQNSKVTCIRDGLDGDCKLQMISDGGFDKDKPGVYTIKFQAIGSDGATTTASATVTVTPLVREPENPHKPTQEQPATPSQEQPATPTQQPTNPSKVNPTAEQSESNGAKQNTAKHSAENLAQTGSSAGVLLAIAASIMVVGTALVTLRRRTRG